MATVSGNARRVLWGAVAWVLIWVTAAPGIARAEVLLPANASECLIIAAMSGSAPAEGCEGRSLGLNTKAFRQPLSATMTFNQRPGRTVAFPVTFRINSHDLTVEAQDLLTRIGDAIRKLPRTNGYSIAGHTDLSGPRARNIALSRERAEAVANFLVQSKGIGPERLQFAGFGPDEPIDPQRPYDPSNRRVTFYVHEDAVRY